MRENRDGPYLAHGSLHEFPRPHLAYRPARTNPRQPAPATRPPGISTGPSAGAIRTGEEAAGTGGAHPGPGRIAAGQERPTGVGLPQGAGGDPADHRGPADLPHLADVPAVLRMRISQSGYPP